MYLTVDGKVLGNEPAVVAHTRLEPKRSYRILSPIGTLVWKHFFAYRGLKVDVANLSITILIKISEKLVKLFH